MVEIVGEVLEEIVEEIVAESERVRGREIGGGKVGEIAAG